MTKRVLGTGAAGDLPEQNPVAAVEVVEEIEDVAIIDEDNEEEEQ